MRQSHKTILLWILLILMFVMLWQVFNSSGKGEDKKDFGVLMSELQDPAQRENIKKLTIQPRATGTTAKYIVEYKDDPTKKTVVQGEFSGETSKMIRDTGFTNYAVEGKDESTFWQSVIITWLPMIFLFVIFIFFIYSMVKAFVPRYRYDQLMRLGWKIFLPLSLAMVVITAFVLKLMGWA